MHCRRGRLELDQIKLIRIGIDHAAPQKWSDQVEDLVTEGRLSVKERLFLDALSSPLTMTKPKKSDSEHFGQDSLKFGVDG